LTKVLTEDPRRPRDLDRTIPEGVESLIQQAMAREPAQRPAKIQDLERLLVAFDPMASGASGARGDGGGVASKWPDGGALAGADTLDVPPEPSAAEQATRRARRARPLAFAWAVTFAVCAGATVLVTSATIVRLVTGRAKFSDDEVTLAVAISLGTSSSSAGRASCSRAGVARRSSIAFAPGSRLRWFGSSYRSDS
jgi:serine/threonine-protein kinase